MSEWVMDQLTGNRMQRGASPALHVVKGDVDTLTRETGQNSRDQKSGKAPTKVLYTLIELSGKRKTEFLKAMDWPRLRKHLISPPNGEKNWERYHTERYQAARAGLAKSHMQ
jgi:hypothetical protein